MRALSTENAGIVDGDFHAFLMVEGAHRLGRNFLTLVHASDTVFFSREEGESPSPLLQRVSAESLQDLRAFTQSGELRLWKWNGEIRWRFRTDVADESAGEIETYDEKHVLWGNSCEESDGSMVARESGRGFAFRLPVSAKDRSLPLKMYIRNYFTFEADGLLRFFDARIVSLTDNEGGML